MGFFKEMFSRGGGFSGGGGIGVPYVPPPEYFKSQVIHEKATIAMKALLIHHGTSLSSKEIVDKAYEIGELMSQKKA